MVQGARQSCQLTTSKQHDGYNGNKSLQVGLVTREREQERGHPKDLKGQKGELSSSQWKGSHL